jgi:nicotinate-nucleotide adenylyltransferase
LTKGHWGILGGTFDPVHYAHLAMAEQTREALGLQGVMFIPAGQPVHKPMARASAEDRLAMLELATADNPAFVVSRLEVDSDREGYSVNTLEQLTAERPDDRFVLIMSSEAARALPTWRGPERLLALCRVAVVPRLGYEMPSREWLAENFPGQEDRFVLVEASRLGHSATEVRARIADGRSIRYLVPPAVEAYISQHHLYAN